MQDLDGQNNILNYNSNLILFHSASTVARDIEVKIKN